MSDWEDFCDDMGWKNDESAYEKLDRYINESGVRTRKFFSPRYSKKEFTPEQKRLYAKKKFEERCLLKTPVAQFINQHIGVITQIDEKEWVNKEEHYKAICIELYGGGIFMTVAKIDDACFEVTYDQLCRGVPQASVRDGRLTGNLIKRAEQLYFELAQKNFVRKSRKY